MPATKPADVAVPPYGCPCGAVGNHSDLEHDTRAAAQPYSEEN